MVGSNEHAQLREALEVCLEKDLERILLSNPIQRRLQKRGGFFRFTSIKPLTERIDAFDEFLHRKPGKQANPSK